METVTRFKVSSKRLETPEINPTATSLQGEQQERHTMELPVFLPKVNSFLVWLLLNVPVNNFSVMLGRSHCFLLPKVSPLENIVKIVSHFFSPLCLNRNNYAPAIRRMRKGIKRCPCPSVRLCVLLCVLLCVRPSLK